MDNEHNPISIRIRQVQDLWLKVRSEKPHARAFVMNYTPEDYALIEGFIGIESTPHGISDDTFLVFRTLLDNKGDFYKSLIEQWITAFEKDLESHPEWHWNDFAILKEQYHKLSPKDEHNLLSFYSQLLHSFKRFEGVTGNLLVLVLLIERVESFDVLHEVLKEFLDATDDYIGLFFMEVKGEEIFSPIIKKMEDKGCVVELPNQNMGAAYKEIITQGDPNDPQVQYRKLLLEMGEETAKSNRKRLYKIATEEFFPLCKKIGDTNLWISGYLAVSGFLMHFIKEEAEHLQQMLDKALAVIQEATPADEPLMYADLMIHCYLYKGAAYAMAKDLEKASSHFMNAIRISKQTENHAQTINCYNSILLVLLKKERTDYTPILKEAFEYGYSLTDEELKLINISFIAQAFLSKGENVSGKLEQEINDRMVTLYGVHWQESPKDAIRRIEKENKVPQ